MLRREMNLDQAGDKLLDMMSPDHRRPYDSAAEALKQKPVRYDLSVRKVPNN